MSLKVKKRITKLFSNHYLAKVEEKMNKKGQSTQRLLRIVIGVIIGWVVLGSITPEISIIGGVVGGFLAYKFL